MPAQTLAVPAESAGIMSSDARNVARRWHALSQFFHRNIVRMGYMVQKDQEMR